MSNEFATELTSHLVLIAALNQPRWINVLNPARGFRALVEQRSPHFTGS